MATSKYTPGPWQVKICGNGERCISAQGDPNPLAAIAWTHEPSSQRPAHVVDANALVMALAPELVEALREAIDFIGCGCAGSSTPIFDKATALLAKLEE